MVSFSENGSRKDCEQAKNSERRANFGGLFAHRPKLTSQDVHISAAAAVDAIAVDAAAAAVDATAAAVGAAAAVDVTAAAV